MCQFNRSRTFCRQTIACLWLPAVLRIPGPGLANAELAPPLVFGCQLYLYDQPLDPDWGDAVWGGKSGGLQWYREMCVIGAPGSAVPRLMQGLAKLAWHLQQREQRRRSQGHRYWQVARLLVATDGPDE